MYLQLLKNDLKKSVKQFDLAYVYDVISSNFHISVPDAWTVIFIDFRYV